MKRIFSTVTVVFLAVYMSLSVGAATDFGFKLAVEHLDSLDGRYSYAVDKQTGEAYFTSSNEDDITVLHIPDEIDGNPIVGVYGLHVESPCVTKIVFGNNIKKVYSEGLIVTTASECEVPICSMVLNEGLERILTLTEDYVYSKKMGCPFLILPKSLSFIGEEGINTKNYKNIIFQSDSITLASSVTTFSAGEETECSVYLTESAEQMDPLTFYCHNYFKGYYLDERIHVYGNGDSYPFPVEKYTENFWENIKETEKVTLDKNEVRMKIGRQERIKASIYPADAYDGRVFFASFDEEIATVDSEGYISPLKCGTTTIRAVAASGAYADCTVTVDEPAGFGGRPSVDYVDSSDGRYGYAVNKKTGEAYFMSSYEEDITILRIPEEIDGKPIVGIYDLYVASPCVTKIVFGKNVKTIFREGLIVTNVSEYKIPVCSVVLNEGLEYITEHAQLEIGHSVKKMDCPVLILPKSLSFIGEEGLDITNYENIVFQSDPVTVRSSVGMTDDLWDRDCSVYLTESAEQMDPKSFYYRSHHFEEGPNPVYHYINSNVHVYGNGDSYPFPVEKYTENFWENIKETEKVTLDKSEVQLKAGRSADIKASIYPADAYDGRVFYASLDEETASVDSEGKITAIKDGTATIRAVAASGAYADCTVTVGETGASPINMTVIYVFAGAVALIVIAYTAYRLKKRK